MLRHIEGYLKLSIAGSFFFGGLATGQEPTLIFPQIAGGEAIRLEIVLTNPASLEDKGTIFFNPFFLRLRSRQGRATTTSGYQWDQC